MRTKYAVTDACIFIDLYDLGLISTFFGLDIEIHITSAIYFDLHEEHQQVLKAYQSINKLIIHNLKEQDFLEIHSDFYPNSLSETDKSVLHVANKLNACVLSSNKIIRELAVNKTINYHGMIWIFDNLVSCGILSPQKAVEKLNDLIAKNFIFQNNKFLKDEIHTRIKLWK